MSEEYGNDFVTLIDEDGNEVEFEHIDTVEFSGRGHKIRVNSAASLSEAKHFISVRSCPVRQQSFFNPHF